MAHIIFLESMSPYEPCAPLKFFAGSASDLVGHPSSRSDRKHNYKDIYLQLLNCMVFMLRDTFSDIENFEFLNLDNPNFFSM